MSDSVLLKRDEKCEYFVRGMHCAACEVIVETKLKKTPEVKNVDVSLYTGKVAFEIESGTINEQVLLDRLNVVLEPDGYTVVKEKIQPKINYRELFIALVIAGAIIEGFFLLQRIGIANVLGGKTLSLQLVFLVGIIASLSSCMALVGGLVLSISSSYAKSKDRVVPLVSFHVSRLISFFVLGGIIGFLGSVFSISPTGYLVIGVILFITMIILGLNLLDVFSFTKRLQLKMPKIFANKATILVASEHWAIPTLLGTLTFFLPCGFTQSMQLTAMASGSFLTGAFTMLVFSLGTLPMFALISFTSLTLSKSLQSGIFFKTAGFLVLFFAVFNLLSALIAAGVITPIF